MAENENGQERTEEATPRRLEKAREEGQVARSRELATAFVLLGGVSGLIGFGPGLGRALADQMRFNFSLSRDVAFDTSLAVAHLGASVSAAAWALMPLLVLLALAGIAAPLVMGGVLFSSKALMPKGNRINPLSGFKRMFSMNALVELLKAIAKFLLLAGLAVVIITGLEQRLLAMGLQALEPALAAAWQAAAWAVLGVSCGMILIAAIDVPWQLFEHKKKLKMSFQEVKEEMKDTEGKPEVKGRIRQLQREMARRRMMEAVPQADVVITNPEHFSVALRYDPDKGGAPVVLAKGVDHLALKIREVAKAHDIYLLPAPQLARAIYFTTEVDHEIPSQLYLAVAQVLAYVFQLKAWRKGEGRAPQPLGDPPVPEEMRYDARGKRAEE
ncbi:MAG: flagellar biosynthesis protein FlhB [Spongiibacteraceae bacterium]|jgi:flagellar biosynthetic protein FlhB|nr:flagellar biosynthesis protein FlhB [Spongiibacteraceae bacterium]